jgi:hypothetical protein
MQSLRPNLNLLDQNLNFQRSQYKTLKLLNYWIKVFWLNEVSLAGIEL